MMHFKAPLRQGILIKRYKRFLADIDLHGEGIITAHCANSGALYGVTSPNLPVWVSPHFSPSRKLKYTWEMVEKEGILIGVNTSHPNRLVEEAIQANALKEFSGYALLQREVRYGAHSRLDFLLQDECQKECFVEVKNVHMSRSPHLAEFPDAVTARGTKHLLDMISIVEQGKRGAMIYIIQRPDCTRLTFAKDIDPVYAHTAYIAQQKGVGFYAYSCRLTPQGIQIESSVPVLF